MPTRAKRIAKASYAPALTPLVSAARKVGSRRAPARDKRRGNAARRAANRKARFMPSYRTGFPCSRFVKRARLRMRRCPDSISCVPINPTTATALFRRLVERRNGIGVAACAAIVGKGRFSLAPLAAVIKGDDFAANIKEREKRRVSVDSAVADRPKQKKFARPALGDSESSLTGRGTRQWENARKAAAQRGPRNIVAATMSAAISSRTRAAPEELEEGPARTPVRAADGLRLNSDMRRL
jgi:hypothetical protein